MHERMRGDLQQQVQAGAEMIEKVPIPGLRPTGWDQTQQKVKKAFNAILLESMSISLHMLIPKKLTTNC